MEYIISRENPVIKETKKLKDKKHREDRKQFFIEGVRFVSEALESDFEIPLLFICQDSDINIENFNIKSNTRVYSLPQKVFKEISFTENPQGIAAVVNYSSIKPKGSNGFYILADRVQDPGNLGTIIRSAHASGALGTIVTKGTVDVYNDKTLRSTMGSIFHIPVIIDNDLSFINKLKAQGFKLVVSSLEAENNFFEEDLRDNIIIALGNEGAGISDEVSNISDIKVKIPMPGGAESLNVSAAASIMMFEVVRQKIIDNKLK
ncbi:MAG: TrmH family RNA methyltransferase [Solirubrobacterales bacterium]